MKLILTIVSIAAMGITSTAYAECPSGLTADEMHECIMMESNGNFNYREWASEFYAEVNPDKAAVIKTVYKNSDIKVMRANTKHRKIFHLSISSTQ